MGIAASDVAANDTDPFVALASEACFSCHAADPSSYAYPRHPPPKIAGQHPEYLHSTLIDYLRHPIKRTRNHFIMSSQSLEIPEEALPRVVAIISGTDGKYLPSYPAPDLDLASIARGEALAGSRCVECHDPNLSTHPSDVPILNGQYPRYLVAAMIDYRVGVRHAKIMQERTYELSEAEIDDLAAYYGSLKGLYP